MSSIGGLFVFLADHSLKFFLRRCNLHRSREVLSNGFEQRHFVSMNKLQAFFDQFPQWTLGNKVGEERRQLVALPPVDLLQIVLERLTENRPIHQVPVIFQESERHPTSAILEEVADNYFSE